MLRKSDSRAFLVLLTALAVWLAWLVVRPFASLLFLAAVASVALGPLRGWLSVRMRVRRGVAAALVTLLAILAVLGPLAAIGTVVVGQAINGVRLVFQVLDEKGVLALAAYLPEWSRGYATGLLGRLPHGAKALEGFVTQTLSTNAFFTVGGVLQATGTAFASLLLFFVALFFLLADGHRFVDWLLPVLPMPTGKAAVLLGYLRRVTLSVVVSTLATSGVQAGLGFAGYLLADVPYALFFAVATFFSSLIPVVGSALVWVPLVLLKLSTGHPVAAGFLTAWSALVVGMADNVVKPALMRRGIDFPVGVVFFALLGGLAAFGPVGFVAGPLAIAFLVAVVQTWSEP